MLEWLDPAFSLVCMIRIPFSWTFSDTASKASFGTSSLDVCFHRWAYRSVFARLAALYTFTSVLIDCALPAFLHEWGHCRSGGDTRVEDVVKILRGAAILHLSPSRVDF